MASVESKSARSECLLILRLCSAALRVFRTGLCSPKFLPRSYERRRFSRIFLPKGGRPFRSRPRTVIYQNDLKGLVAKIAGMRSTRGPIVRLPMWTRITNGGSAQNYKHGVAETLHTGDASDEQCQG